MAGVGVSLADAVAPDLIVAADAVEELFAGQGVKGPVKSDTVDSLGQKFENLRCAEGLMALLENFQDSNADGGAAKPGLVEELIGGFFGPGHDNIIYGVHPKGRRQ
jgi:hypothetical protein